MKVVYKGTNFRNNSCDFIFRDILDRVECCARPCHARGHDYAQFLHNFQWIQIKSSGKTNCWFITIKSMLFFIIWKVVSNLTAMNLWDAVCMGFIYTSFLEFVVVNYLARSGLKDKQTIWKIINLSDGFKTQIFRSGRETTPFLTWVIYWPTKIIWDCMLKPL